MSAGDRAFSLPPMRPMRTGGGPSGKTGTVPPRCGGRGPAAPGHLVSGSWVHCTNGKPPSKRKPAGMFCPPPAAVQSLQPQGRADSRLNRNGRSC